MKKVAVMMLVCFVSVCFAGAREVLMRFEGSVKNNGYHVVYDDANSKIRWNGSETFEEFKKRCSGKPTIGYGFTSKTLVSRCKLTDKDAIAELDKIIARINKKIDTAVKVPLTENQRIALISFIFNVGGKNFENSTMLKKLNNKDYEGASKEFDKWVYTRVNGKKAKSKGLISRRSSEKKLFLTK